MIGAKGFLAWVRAVLRRPPPAAAPPPVWRFGSVVIDSSTRSVTKNDKEVRLSRAEYGLLLRLIKQAGSVVEQRALLEEVLGPPEQLESKYLRMFVQGLRMKLEDDPDHPQLILRVGCRGYRLGGSTGAASGEAVRSAEPPPD